MWILARTMQTIILDSSQPHHYATYQLLLLLEVLHGSLAQSSLFFYSWSEDTHSSAYTKHRNPRTDFAPLHPMRYVWSGHAQGHYYSHEHCLRWHRIHAEEAINCGEQRRQTQVQLHYLVEEWVYLGLTVDFPSRGLGIIGLLGSSHTINMLDTEVCNYTALQNLQGVDIPPVPGYYDVWGLSMMWVPQSQKMRQLISRRGWSLKYALTRITWRDVFTATLHDATSARGVTRYSWSD
jgi:hypothetical protein